MKKFLMLASLWMMLGLIIACQPNPEEPIVVNKGDNKLDNLIAQTNSNFFKLDNSTWKEKFNVYENNSPNVSMHVFIDAVVRVPDADKFPVANVKQRRFNKNDIKTLTDIFFSGDIKIGSGYMTLEEINQAIVELKQTIYKLQDYPNSEGTIAQLEYEITQYEYKKSNSVEFNTLPDADWNKIKDDPGYVSLISLDNGKTASILIENSESSTESRLAYYENKYAFLVETVNDHLTTYKPYGEEHAKGTQTSLTKVKELADNVSARLDKDMQYYGYSIRAKEQIQEREEIISIEKECYVLHYTRQIQNAPATYACQSAQYSESYGEPWNYEFMTFFIDDTGIIAFTWDNPKQVLETINSNVAMLSFEKIQEFFKKQISIRNAWITDASEYYDYTTMTVTRVELGMTIVKKKDTKDEFMVIPVWDFFGGYTTVISDKALTEWGLTKKTEDSIIWEDLSQLTINAIDGSIIDRSLGY